MQNAGHLHYLSKFDFSYDRGKHTYTFLQWRFMQAKLYYHWVILSKQEKFDTLFIQTMSTSDCGVCLR